MSTAEGTAVRGPLAACPSLWVGVVTWQALPLLVLEVEALPTVLRGRGALLRLAGQLDVAPDHGLAQDAAVRFGGWHCVGGGKGRHE